MANFKYTDAKGEWRVLEFKTTDSDRGVTLCTVTPYGSDYRDVKTAWVVTEDLIVDADPGPTYDTSGYKELPDPPTDEDE